MNAKFFLTASAVLALIAFESIYSTMYGQNKNYLCNNGYKANVQASSLVSYEDFLGALSTSHGYAFENGIYLGGGTGIGFRPWDIQGEKNIFNSIHRPDCRRRSRFSDTKSRLFHTSIIGCHSMENLHCSRIRDTFYEPLNIRQRGNKHDAGKKRKQKYSLFNISRI